MDTQDRSDQSGSYRVGGEWQGRLRRCTGLPLTEWESAMLPTMLPHIDAAILALIRERQ
jgi:hypothetical protein